MRSRRVIAAIIFLFALPIKVVEILLEPFFLVNAKLEDVWLEQHVLRTCLLEATWFHGRVSFFTHVLS